MPLGSNGGERPSFEWQAEQERWLKRGPSPSRPSVVAGAVTQLRLKIEWPNVNVEACSSVRFFAWLLYACEVASKTVVSPPENASAAIASVTEGEPPSSLLLHAAMTAATTTQEGTARRFTQFSSGT